MSTGSAAVLSFGKSAQTQEVEDLFYDLEARDLTEAEEILHSIVERVRNSMIRQVAVRVEEGWSPEGVG